MVSKHVCAVHLSNGFSHIIIAFEEIRVRNIEITTQVPKKFRFPMFSKLVIYSVVIIIIKIILILLQALLVCRRQVLA